MQQHLGGRTRVFAAVAALAVAWSLVVPLASSAAADPAPGAVPPIDASLQTRLAGLTTGGEPAVGEAVVNPLVTMPTATRPAPGVGTYTPGALVANTGYQGAEEWSWTDPDLIGAITVEDCRVATTRNAVNKYQDCYALPLDTSGYGRVYSHSFAGQLLITQDAPVTLSDPANGFRWQVWNTSGRTCIAPLDDINNWDLYNWSPTAAYQSQWVTIWARMYSNASCRSDGVGYTAFEIQEVAPDGAIVRVMPLGGATGVPKTMTIVSTAECVDVDANQTSVTSSSAPYGPGDPLPDLPAVACPAGSFLRTLFVRRVGDRMPTRNLLAWGGTRVGSTSTTLSEEQVRGLGYPAMSMSDPVNTATGELTDSSSTSRSHRVVSISWPPVATTLTTPASRRWGRGGGSPTTSGSMSTRTGPSSTAAGPGRSTGSPDGAGGFVAPPMTRYTLTAAGGGFTLGGVEDAPVRTFAATGELTSITDRDGATVTLAYGSAATPAGVYVTHAADGTGDVDLAGAVAAAGGTVTVGRFDGTVGFGGTSLTSGGGFDGVAVRTATDGTVDWAVPVGTGTGGTTLRDAAATADGGVVVVGQFTGTETFGSMTLTSAGNLDGVVVKLDAAGQVVWAVSAASGTSAAELTGVTATTDGGAVVSGFFWATATVGATTLTSAGAYDGLAFKLAGDGTPVWATRLGTSTGNVYPNAVATAADGSILVVGEFEATATFGAQPALTSAGGRDAFLVAVGTDGTVTRATRVGTGAYSIYPQDLVATGDGGAVFVGYHYGTATFGGTSLPSAGDVDGMIVRVDGTGTPVWATEATGAGTVKLVGVDVTAAGDVVVAGRFKGTVTVGSDTATSAGAYDGLVARLDGSGTPVWATAVGVGAGDTYLEQPVATSAGGATVVGVFDGTADFGSDTLTSSGSFDGVVFQIAADGTFTASPPPAGNGGLLAQVSGPGGAIDLTYTDGLITAATSDDGRTVTYAYTSDRLTSVTLPGARTWTYAYDTSGRLATTVDPAGVTVQSSVYDANGDVVQQTDANGHVFTFGTTRGADGTGTTWMDGPDGRWVDVYIGHVPVAKVSPDELVTTYSYDTDGRLAEIRAPSGAVTTFGYDARGNLAQTSLPDGAVATTTYDSHDRPTSSVGSDGRTTSITYDTDGRPATVTDHWGRTTTFGYDTAGNVTSVTGADGTAATATYDLATGLVLSTTDAAGATTTVAYDPADRPVRTVDARGNLPGADPDDYATTVTYDPAGRPATVTDPLGRTLTTSYDNAGRPTAVTDSTGRTVTTGYDDAGHPTSVQGPDPAAPAQTFTYDSSGLLTGLTDAAGRTTTLSYTPSGHLAGVVDPAATASMTYDTRGRAAAATLAGAGIAVTRDVYGNLTGLDAPGTDADVTITRTATDGPTGTAGRVAQVSDAVGVTSFTYTDRGEVASATRGTDTFAYTYDLMGRLETRTRPDGSVESYTYDAAGRPGTVALDGQTLATTTYDPAGLPTQLDLANATTERRSYDQAGRVTRVELSSAGTGGTGPAPFVSHVGDDTGAVTLAAQAATSAGTVTAGEFSGTETFGNDTLTSSGATDGVAVATDTTGTVVWTTAFGTGTGDITVNDAAATADGGVIVAGNFDGTATFGTDTFTSAGGNDAFVVKLDSTGQVVWAFHALVGTSLASLEGVATTSDGGVVATGFFWAAASVGTTDLASTGDFDGATFKLDTSGQLAWATATGHSLEKVLPDAVAATTDGGAIVIGEFDGTATFGSAPSMTADGTSADVFTVKLDSAGQIVTATHAGSGSVRIYPRAATATADGGAVFVGYYTGDATFGTTATLPSASGRDAMAVKVDSTGVPVWATRAGTGASDVKLYGVDTTAMGDIVATGAFAGTATFGTDTFVSAGGSDGIVIALDATGQPSWATPLATGTGDTDLAALDVTTDGRLAVTGSFDQTVDVGPDTLVSAGQNDGLVAALAADGTFTSGPAPAGEVLTALDYTYNDRNQVITRVDEAGNASGYVYDAAGRLARVCYGQPVCDGSETDFIAWTYDPVGNRLTEQRPTGTTSYSYTGGRLTSVTRPDTTVDTVTYDPAGNVTAVGPDTFTWDAVGRMTSATVDGATESYTYDSLGARVAAGTAAHVYDPIYGDLVEERDGTGATVRAYLPAGLGIDGADGREYFHRDLLLTVRAATDATGALTGQADFEPYGALRTASAASASPVSFTGALADTTGLMHMRARQYDPALGIFLSPDPLGGGYLYANDNPMMYIDPYGTKGWLSGAGDWLKANAGTIATGLAIAATAVTIVGTGGLAAPALTASWLGAGAVAFGATEATNLAIKAGESCGAGKGSCTTDATIALIAGATLGTGTAAITSEHLTATTIARVAPEAIRGLQFADDAAQGFGSMSSFRRAYGSAGPNAQWHHIVEQHTGNVGRFGADSIHNTSNIIRLDTTIHRQVSGYYSSIQPFTSGQTVRQWLGTQPFDAQRQFGLDVLQRFGAAG